MKTRNIGLWIGALALLVLDIGVHCVRAQNGGIPAVIKTQDLQINDTSGQDMIDLDIAKEGSPIIGFNDKQENVRMGLIVTEDGGNVQMIDPAGKTTLAISGGTTPGVHLLKNNELKAQLGLRSGGWPALALSDKEDSDRTVLAYDPTTDTTTLQATDKVGAQCAEMSVSPKYAIVDVSDKGANRRAGMTCMSDTGTPHAFIADTSGNMVWQKSDSD